MVSHWSVNAVPYDMCMITPSEVALAVDDDSNTHEVQFITVTHNQLVSGRKFKLPHTCKSIAHHQGDLFITSGTALYKYTLSGKQICRLHEDLSGSFTV
ncbi:hypothetical protein DPMN_003456 [Dreissena polymorpha]|uniref:Uncharacterized protein n=1 Tax=Dreissena polymorpha TaxID=45954 RepID=A0A9D4RUT0_DREPO|nr:hypothetical protein DPMN_003456 [Dreissena polymorpha]